MIYDLVVVGGGAAGFYGAIHLAGIVPGCKVLIVEKTPKLLSKVRISGGGRCNVTHACDDRIKLSQHYPRGEKFLKEVFRQHAATDVVQWFQSKGVNLKTEEDGRMFPTTDDSETIIACLMSEAHRHKIRIELSNGVKLVQKVRNHFSIVTEKGDEYHAKNILVASGGHPGRNAYSWLEKFGLTIVDPKPSLFTFNDSAKTFTELMGISVEHAEVRIAGTKLSSTGPLLITHWGLSGPCVIRLSAWAAEYLFDIRYEFTALVSWIGPAKETEVRAYLEAQRTQRSKQKVTGNPLYGLPQRLWTKLCELSEIPDTKIWAELPIKNQNRLMELLIRCPFQIRGKTTFKEEFVTCGGVDLSEVDVQTMESKKHPGLLFAGEVLNIDGETGGFNFQAAWSTAYLAAQTIKRNLSRQEEVS